MLHIELDMKAENTSHSNEQGTLSWILLLYQFKNWAMIYVITDTYMF